MKNLWCSGAYDKEYNHIEEINVFTTLQCHLVASSLHLPAELLSATRPRPRILHQALTLQLAITPARNLYTAPVTHMAATSKAG